MDRRTAFLTHRDLRFRVFLRVPLGTALVEELVFRGILFAALRPHGTFTAALVSSAAFGLWHLAPSYNLRKANQTAPSVAVSSRIQGFTFMAGAVVLTSLAGLALTWMRINSGGIAAPFALHATLNSLATVASHRAARVAGMTKLEDTSK